MFNKAITIRQVANGNEEEYTLLSLITHFRDIQIEIFSTYMKKRGDRKKRRREGGEEEGREGRREEWRENGGGICHTYLQDRNCT